MIIPLLFLAAIAAPPPTVSPPIHSVGFLGRPGGLCENRSQARRGECVDVVEFLDLERAWGARPPRLVDLAAWRTVADLYAYAWEDLAYRWTAPDLEQTLRASGFTQLPSASVAWDRSDLSRGAYALPARDTYLGVGVWLDPLATPEAERTPGTFFPHVRYRGPEGQQALPRTVKLAGRFAERLGFDGRRHDYDVMDGDPASSGPFFEQMFPYNRQLSTRGQSADAVYAAYERDPLAAFRFPAHLHDATSDPLEAIRAFDESFSDISTADSEMQSARELAGAQFNRFVRVVYVQAAQYAMEDVTRNQMRVVAALTAMATPPSVIGDQGGIARDLVAAARGETDTSSEILTHFDEGALKGVPSGIHVRYERLPFAVVSPWVASLTEDERFGPEFYAALDADLTAILPTMLRPDRPPLTSLELSSRRTWLRDALLPGNDRTEVDAEILRIALARMLEAVSAEMRDRIETWMLVDQTRLGIAATFDDSRVATPAEVVEAATVQWQQILGMHGYPTELLAQGLGAVDPTAICTTRDGLEGLDEPVFRPITVDILTSAPPGSEDDAILAAGRGKVPFLFVDDPDTNMPTIEPLVLLGNGQQLYRVRWEVWTGWHLLWDLAPASKGRNRLMLRTAALCDDMVLTSPELAPTVIRAGLLQGNLRPTTPEKRGAPKLQVQGVDSEGVSGAITGAPDKAAGALAQAQGLKEMADPAAIEGIAGMNPAVGPGAYEIVLEDLRPEAEYLRGLAYRPLEHRLTERGGLLFVADVGAPGEAAALHDRVPRTPYTRVRGKVRGKNARGERADPGQRRINSAGWMWFVQPEERPIQISPAYTPKDSVSGDQVPRWSRRSTADYTLTIGGAFTPWRSVRFQCATAEAGVADECVGAGTTTSEGFGIDVQGLGTWWFHDLPRVGLDVGIEARMDLRRGGSSWFWDERNKGTRYNWTLRPGAGLITGLHFAPRPGPLWRHRSRGTTWGASRADGRAKLSRTQVGIRGSVLAGPGFNGLEGTLGIEGWAASSIRGRRGKHASFTPYHPRVLLGPFLRFQLGIPLTDGSDPLRFLMLDNSKTLFFGLRTHFGLDAAAPPPPEVE